MQCVPELVGVEYYWAGIAFFVGGALRFVKKIPAIKPDYLPAVAFACGFGIDVGVGYLGCGEAPQAAALTGLAGGLAGLVAVGGHEALLRTARGAGLEPLAERLLGKATAQKEAQEDDTE